MIVFCNNRPRLAVTNQSTASSLQHRQPHRHRPWAWLDFRFGKHVSSLFSSLHFRRRSYLANLTTNTSLCFRDCLIVSNSLGAPASRNHRLTDGPRRRRSQRADKTLEGGIETHPLPLYPSLVHHDIDPPCSDACIQDRVSLTRLL